MKWTRTALCALTLTFAASTAAAQAEFPPRGNISVVLVVDMSYSMKTNRLLAPLRRALQQSLYALRYGDEITVVFFGDATWTIKKKIGNREDMKSFAGEIATNMVNTNLQQKTHFLTGLEAGLQRLETLTTGQDAPFGVILFLTDGKDELTETYFQRRGSQARQAWIKMRAEVKARWTKLDEGLRRGVTNGKWTEITCIELGKRTDAEKAAQRLGGISYTYQSKTGELEKLFNQHRPHASVKVDAHWDEQRVTRSYQTDKVVSARFRVKLAYARSHTFRIGLTAKLKKTQGDTTPMVEVTPKTVSIPGTHTIKVKIHGADKLPLGQFVWELTSPGLDKYDNPVVMTGATFTVTHLATPPPPPAPIPPTHWEKHWGKWLVVGLLFFIAIAILIWYLRRPKVTGTLHIKRGEEILRPRVLGRLKKTKVVVGSGGDVNIPLPSSIILVAYKDSHGRQRMRIECELILKLDGKPTSRGDLQRESVIEIGEFTIKYKNLKLST